MAAAAQKSPIPPVGYEHVGYRYVGIKPPAVKQDSPPDVVRKIVSLPPPYMTENDVRIAVAAQVAEKDQKSLRGMRLHSVTSGTTYIYNVSRFYQTRSIKWIFVPLKDPNADIDGRDRGVPPAVWDMEATSEPQLFKVHKNKLYVPHSQQVVTCHKCLAKGSLTCSSCAGVGSRGCEKCHASGVIKELADLRACTLCDGEEEAKKHCNKCEGSGVRKLHETQKLCSPCNGNGKIVCSRCSGRGIVTCGTCDGHLNLKFHIRLRIYWRIESSAGTSNDGFGLNMDRILTAGAGSKAIFQESGPVVRPIETEEFPEEPVVAAVSREKINKLLAGNGRVLQMSHWIAAVPITVVQYQQGKELREQDKFYVYGDQKIVFFPRPPFGGDKKCVLL